MRRNQRVPVSPEIEAKASRYLYLANLFKVLANPTRLQILELLSDKKKKATKNYQTS
jgi:hypothetical protein